MQDAPLSGSEAPTVGTCIKLEPSSAAARMSQSRCLSRLNTPIASMPLPGSLLLDWAEAALSGLLLLGHD